MTIRFLELDYKYFYFLILVFLYSCDLDNKSFFERKLNKEPRYIDPRTYHIEKSEKDTEKYLEKFKKYISNDFKRYRFDILLDDELLIGNDSIYFPVYKYDVNPKNDYYGLWLLNLKTLNFESKYKLDSNTLFFSNDCFRVNSKIVVPPDTLIYINFDVLRVVNFKNNELLFEDSINEKTKVDYGIYYSGKGLIAYDHPYIYTLDENIIYYRNIKSKSIDSILIKNSFYIKSFVRNNDSIIFFGYDSKKGINQTCIFELKKHTLSFNDLILNFIDDKIDILDIHLSNRSIYILTNHGIFEYNLDSKFVDKIFNLQIEYGYFYISKSILTLVSFQKDQEYLTKYNLILQEVISNENIPLGCLLISENVYIFEGGRGLYILDK